MLPIPPFRGTISTTIDLRVKSTELNHIDKDEIRGILRGRLCTLSSTIIFCCVSTGNEVTYDH